MNRSAPAQAEISRILIANRGEVALRIAQAAAELGLPFVCVHARDEVPPLIQVLPDDEPAPVRALAGEGPAAYLDIEALIAAAQRSGCDAVHPGYGFLSESAGFARACAAAGLVFIGASPEQLQMLGDKTAALALARRCQVPVLAGSEGPVNLQQAQAFMAAQGGAPVLLKAAAGGGGRGLRLVQSADTLQAALARCASEAHRAFGNDAVYIERFVPRARHIELQLLGDGVQVMSLGERECTLQRQHQKLVEMAPSPGLRPALLQAMTQAALKMAQALQLQGLGTFEFLIDAPQQGAFWFIEANPRLQVEHPVTEMVTGLDLVQLQIQLAGGATLASLGLDPSAPPTPRGHALQWRINAETRGPGESCLTSSGVISRWQMPGGPGVRIDSHGHAGWQATPQFDSLLAKLVVHSSSPDFADALRRSQRALAQCAIEGLPTNLALLRGLAARPELAQAGRANLLHTGFVAEQLDRLWPREAAVAPSPDEAQQLRAPQAGRLLSIEVAAGAEAAGGAPLAVLEAMKMEHVLSLPTRCRVLSWLVSPSPQAPVQVSAGQLLAELLPLDDRDVEAGSALDRPAELASQLSSHAAADSTEGTEGNEGTVAAARASHKVARADLQAVLDRQALTRDQARPEAIAARHARGQRSARENIAALCDAPADGVDGGASSFIEYGALAVAAQRSRRSAEDLMHNTPADGLVTGIGSVNANLFGAERSRTAVLAYDATVLAGTQGFRNHQKTDRLLALALRQRLPVVLFAEGGGGRPGDTDMPIVAGLHVPSFAAFARLSGQVPLLGVAAGRCFAGNAALLGCCDLIIATRNSNIGMGGPAMIEGGGLGVFKPEAVGPAPLLHAAGVVDVLVDDETQACALVRRLLACFQGRIEEGSASDALALRAQAPDTQTLRALAPDTQTLRAVVPENRLRVYDMRAALQGLFDRGSVIELQAAWGVGVITALACLDGRAVGVLANNPLHLGGAIDPPAADKAARFMRLCNRHQLPLISLVDTPGFMVGPAIEAQAQVRWASQLFLAGAELRVPLLAVVLRKGYGLGAMAMTGGGFHEAHATVAWPSGEFGGMGLEGAVRLGYRKELQALPEGPEREALFQQLLAEKYAAGSAVNMAATLEIDAVIDPADTRDWLLRALDGAARER